MGITYVFHIHGHWEHEDSLQTLLLITQALAKSI